MRKLFLFTISALTFIAAVLALFFLSDVKIINPNSNNSQVIDITEKDERDLGTRIKDYITGNEENKPKPTFRYIVDDVYLSNIEQPLHFISEYNHLLKKIYINGRERQEDNVVYNPNSSSRNLQNQARLYSQELFKNLNIYNQVRLDLFYDGFLKDKHIRVIVDFKNYNFAFLNDNILVYRNINGNLLKASNFKNELLLNYGQYNWYNKKQNLANKDDRAIINFSKPNSENYFLQPYKNVYAYSGDYKKEAFFTVTYKNEDNTNLQVQNVNENQKIPFVPTPHKRGYTFEKWQLLTFDNKRLEFDPTQPITKDIVLVPVFSKTIYQIRYDTNNGILPDTVVFPQTYTTEDRVEIPKAQREGYEFAGWVDERSTIPVKDFVIEKGRIGNIELTAKWQAEEIEVEFDYNDGQRQNYLTKYQYNQTYVFERPVRKNYLFQGWKNVDNGEILNQTGIFNHRIKLTLQAQWLDNTYNVKFYQTDKDYEADHTYIDDLGINHDYTLEKNSFVNEPKSPVRKGHVFLGWFKDGTTRVSFPYQSSIDTKIVALWRINQYILNFYPNGGDWVINKFTVRNVDEFGPVSYQVKENYGTQVQSSPTTNKHGYVFNGWYKFDPKNPVAGSDEKVSFPFTVDDKDENFIAKWTPKDISIKYDPNQGNMPADHQNLEETVSFEKTFAFPIPTRQNYIFIGWKPRNKHEVITVYDLDLDNENDLVAQWIPRQFKITVLTDSDSYIPDIEKYYQENLTLSQITTPVKTGHTFSHWVLVEEDQTETSLQTQQDLLIDKDKTIKAIYTINTYTISFVVNEEKIGSQLAELKEEAEDKVFSKDTQIQYTINDTKQIPDLTFPGYDFLGWAFLENGLPVKNLEISKRTGDFILYAQWKNKEYTLTYISLNEYGTQTQSEVKIRFKDNYKLKLEFREGHSFKGWYFSNNLSEQTDENKMPDNIQWTYLENKTVYAKFEKNIYKVHFILDNQPYQKTGADFIMNVGYNEYINQTEVQAERPEKVGYNFDGWFIGNNNIYNYSFQVKFDSYAIARFSPKQFTLKYYYINENGDYSSYNSLSVTYDRYFSIPTNRINDYAYKFIFKSWHTESQKANQNDGNKFTSGIWRFTEDQTIYPRYELKKILISIDLNGASFKDNDDFVNKLKQRYNDKVSFIPDENNINEVVFNLDYQEMDVDFTIFNIGNLSSKTDGDLLKDGFVYLGLKDLASSYAYINNNSSPSNSNMKIYKNNITKDYNLIVVFAEKTFTITYDLSNNPDKDYNINQNNIKTGEKFFTPVISRRKDNSNDINKYIQLAGWERNNNGNWEDIQDGDFNYNQDITIRPKWEFKDFDVELDLDGGEVLDTDIETYNQKQENIDQNIKIVKEGNKFILRGKFNSQYQEYPQITKTGYTFTGFYVSGQKLSPSPSSKIIIGQRGILYNAQYSPIAVTIIYKDTNNVITQKADQIAHENRNVLYDTFIQHPNYNFDAYTFLGWYKTPQPNLKAKPQATAERVTDGVFKLLDNLELYAWFEIKRVQININANGGVDPVTGERLEPYYFFFYGTTIKNPKTQWNTKTSDQDLAYSIEDPVRLPIPKKTGYEFENYYFSTDNRVISSDLNVTQTFGGSTNSNRSLYVLYAPLRFDNVLYDNLYNANGQKQAMSKVNNAPIQYDTTYTLLNPQRKGYEFDGWKVYKQKPDKTYDPTDENLLGEISKYNSNFVYQYEFETVLVAQWKQKEYKLIFDTIELQYSKTNTKITAPADFTLNPQTNLYEKILVGEEIYTLPEPTDYKGYYFTNYVVNGSNQNPGRTIGVNNTNYSIQTDTVRITPYYNSQNISFQFYTSNSNYTTRNYSLNQRVTPETKSNTYNISTSEPGYPGANHKNQYYSYGYFEKPYSEINIWDENKDSWGNEFLGYERLTEDFFPEPTPGTRNVQNSGVTIKYYRRGKQYDQSQFKYIYIRSYQPNSDSLDVNNNSQLRDTNYEFDFINDYKVYYGKSYIPHAYKSSLISHDDAINNGALTQITDTTRLTISENTYVVIYQQHPIYEVIFANSYDEFEEELNYTLPEKNTTPENVNGKTPTLMRANSSIYLPIPIHKDPSRLFSYWEYNTRLRNNNRNSIDSRSNIYSVSTLSNNETRLYFYPVWKNKPYIVKRYVKHPTGEILFNDTNNSNYEVRKGSKYPLDFNLSGISLKGFEIEKYILLKPDLTPFENEIEVSLESTHNIDSDVAILAITKARKIQMLYETDQAEYIDSQNPENSITPTDNLKIQDYKRFFKLPNFVKKGFELSEIKFNSNRYSYDYVSFSIEGIDLQNLTVYYDKANLITLIFRPITYYITYDHPFNEGGQNSYSNNPSTYTVSGNEIVLARPKRAGHTFLGWTTSENPDADPLVDFVINNAEAKDLILKSHWKAHKYEIRLIGAEIIDPKNPMSNQYVDRFEAEYGQSIIKPIPKEKPGYRFVSWNIISNVINFPFTVNEDKTRNIWQAIYRPISYEIKYELNGGRFITNNVVNKYEAGSFIIFERPEKQFHIFKGWKSTLILEEPKNSYIIDSTMIGDISVEAIFEPEVYSLKLNLNHGTINDPQQADKKEFEFKYGQTILSFYDNDIAPYKEHYNFTGWFIDGNRVIFPLSIVNSNYNKKVAVAQFEPVNYNIVYDKNGSTTYTGPTIYQKGQTIEIQNPEKPGYNFTHWTLKDDKDQLISDNHKVYSITEDTTGNIKLVANFEKITYNLSVIYNIDGVENEIKQFEFLEKNQNNEPLVEVKEKPGYRFMGWTDDQGTTFNNKQYNVTRDITIFANWEKVFHTVTFINKVPEKQEVRETYRLSHEEQFNSPDILEPGYQVDYFFYYELGKEADKIDIFPILVKKDLTIGVKYKLSTYHIYYDVRDGINNENNTQSTFTIQDTVIVHPANKFGFEFTGWTIRLVSDSETKQRLILGGFDGIVYKADVILTATWAILKSKVEFVTGSQDIIPNQVIPYNTFIQKPKDPTKEGNKFMYWYKDSIYKPFEFEKEKISRDTILYARYIPIIYITNIVYDDFRQNALIVEFSKYIDEISIEPYSFLAKYYLLDYIDISTGAVPLSITPIDYNKLELLFRPSDLTNDLFITFKKGTPLYKDKIQSVSDIAIIEQEYRVNFYIDRFIKTFYANDIVADKVEIENEQYLVITIKDPNSTTSPTIIQNKEDQFEVVLVGLVKSINQYRYKVFLEKGKTIQAPTQIEFTIKVRAENSIIERNFTYTVNPSEVNN